MRRVLAVTARATARPCARPPAAVAPSIATAPRRMLSTTRPTRFFFNRPETRPADIVRDILKAAEDGRPDVVARLYPSLTDLYERSSASSSTRLVQHHEFQRVMRAVARSHRYNLLLRMFRDLPSKFGFDVTPLDHHILVLGLSNAGKMSMALKWLEHMELERKEKQGDGIRPHVSDFNVVLNGWRRKRNLFEMRRVVEAMRKIGIEPNVVTYNTFLSALFEHERVDEVRQLLDEMDKKGVEPDLYTQTALLTGFVDVGEMASAKKVRAKLAPVVEEAVSTGTVLPERYDTAMVNGLLKFESAAHGFDRAVRLAERYRDGGVPLDLWTLNTLAVEGAKDVRTADEGLRILERLEDLVDRQADRKSWSIVIEGLSRRAGPAGQGLEPALELYQLARNRSVEPDSTMLHPLLAALLSPPPTAESFAIAKELYEDFKTSSRSFEHSPDQPIYSLLLRACADPATLDLAYSRAIVSDMKKQGIQLDSETALYQIESLMRAASTFDEAFRAYDEVRALDPSVLSSAAAYNRVLETYLSLSVPSTSRAPAAVAPKHLVMEFLADMRTSGHPANAATYSTILTYYSRSASGTVDLIEHFHSLIKLDVHLDPDTALFNSLLGAYSRVRAFGHAYRVWDSMLANRRSGSTAGPDNRSLSILIDTVGYDATPAARLRGRRVWTDLDRGEGGVGIVRNKHNWDGWVECLCRWRELDEAADVAVVDMVGRDGRPKSNKDTFEILLKFARRTKRRDVWEAMRDKLERYRPEVVDELRTTGSKPLRPWDEATRST
ncbi:hypothetical protein JCM10212_003305 [Sporobolomyces blumeae]